MAYNKRISPEPPRIAGRPLYAEEGDPNYGLAEYLKKELQEFLKTLSLSANQANIGLAILDQQINGSNATGTQSRPIHLFIGMGA